MTERADVSPPPAVSPWSSPVLFFCAVFCWSWGFWIATAALGISVQSTLGKTLDLLGLLGPMLAGIAFTCLTRNKESRRDYWARIFDPRRIPPAWYLIIFLAAPGLWTLAALLEVISGEGAVLGIIGRTLTQFVSAPSTIVPFVIGTFIYGPIPEELGWRGYVLDRLQERWTALDASLILGAIWALYHVPLFYMEGSFHHDQGAWSPWFWLFVAQAIAATVIFTWIFNNTRRSTLGAILFHFMLNLSAELVNVTSETNFYSALLWIAAAMVVVRFCGAATLVGGGQGQSRRAA